MQAGTSKCPKRPRPRMGRQSTAWLSAVLVASVLAAGCSGGTGSTPSNTESPASGKLAIIEKMTMRLQEPVADLDPAINVGNATGQIRILTTGQLYRQDRNGVPQPELVESSETSADGLTTTTTLKPDLKYSDDTQLVAGTSSPCMSGRSSAGREALRSLARSSKRSPPPPTGQWCGHCCSRTPNCHWRQRSPNCCCIPLRR